MKLTADTITPAQLRAWNVGWSADRIAAYFGNRESITAREISMDEAIGHGDRMWVLAHALARKDIWLAYDFALWYAEQALAKVTPEWQAKLAPVFDQLRALRGCTWSAARATEDAAWADDRAARIADRAARAADEARAARGARGAAAWAAWVAWVAAWAARAADDAAWAVSAARTAAMVAARAAEADASDSTAARNRLLHMLES